jgi:transmembrane sensor
VLGVTGPGERRIVALDPGTQLVLNGSTSLTFDRGDARFSSLAPGEALFRVRHDSAHPFTLAPNSPGRSAFTSR